MDVNTSARTAGRFVPVPDQYEEAPVFGGAKKQLSPDKSHKSKIQAKLEQAAARNLDFSEIEEVNEQFEESKVISLKTGKRNQV